MASGQSARDKLVRFFEQAAFDPILGARPDAPSVADQAQPEHVKGAPGLPTLHEVRRQSERSSRSPSIGS
jgi:hypothetical protein